MFSLLPCKIDGCFEMQTKVFDDLRGRFVKVFHEPAFAAHGLETRFAEEYYSVSRRNVIRGLHFQTPPEDHVKLVYCVAGKVLDVVVDLRVGSGTYGQYQLFDLSADKGNLVYIPKGMAHGFCVISDMAVMVYKVSTVYSPEHDQGVRWDSAGISWPTSEGIMSDRDRNFLPFDQFESPFRCE